MILFLSLDQIKLLNIMTAERSKQNFKIAFGWNKPLLKIAYEDCNLMRPRKGRSYCIDLVIMAVAKGPDLDYRIDPVEWLVANTLGFVIRWTLG